MGASPNGLGLTYPLNKNDGDSSTDDSRALGQANCESHRRANDRCTHTSAHDVASHRVAGGCDLLFLFGGVWPREDLIHFGY